MRKATEKELNEARQKLQKEKEDALKKLKDQYQKEQDNEEERLTKEHDAVMKTLGEKAREDALEEEAMLQEGKQDAMRKLKQQIQREQEEEEAALREKKNKALDLLREELQVRVTHSRWKNPYKTHGQKLKIRSPESLPHYKIMRARVNVLLIPRNSLTCGVSGSRVAVRVIFTRHR